MTADAEAGRSGTRGRWAAFPTDEQLPPAPVPVPTVGPVVFSVRFDGREFPVDLSDLPCPRLVRPLAETLRERAGDGGPLRSAEVFKRLVLAVRSFVVFVGAAEEGQAEDVELADLEADHLDAFEQALVDEHGSDSAQPHAVLELVTRVLRAVHEARPEAFAPETAARIQYATREARGRGTTPLDAYPSSVFEAIRQAALGDVRAIQHRILDGERLAALGGDPKFAGWGREENLLWHVAHRAPLTDTDRPRKTIKRLGGVRWLNSRLFYAAPDLVPFLVLLICQTGLEPECAKGLAADCLHNPARGFVSIHYTKRRARDQANKTMRVSDGGAVHHPGGLVMLALRLTARARAAIGASALWVDHGHDGTRESFQPKGGRSRSLRDHVGPWMKRHQLDQLVDHDGRPVRLDLRRLRKSYKSQQYLRAAGVLADFAQGHSQQTAARHYADIGAHRALHEQAVEDGLQEALAVALPPPVLLDEDGSRLDDGDQQLPPEQVQAALSGAADVFLASCRDFYDTPYATAGKPCPVPFWGCLECPNAVFTTRHLPQVLSFLDFIERQRDEFPAAEWNLRYGLAWERIVRGIRCKFRDEQIATARAIAEGSGARLLLPPEFLEGVA